VIIVQPLLDETIIEHFKSLEKAVECSSMNDSMVIYAGSYNVGALVLKHPLSISGNGDAIGNQSKGSLISVSFFSHRGEAYPQESILIFRSKVINYGYV
jgi:hypothetical protein